MTTKIINQSISKETLFNLNKKLQKKYNKFYAINRQKTPIMLVFNTKYTDITKKLIAFFSAGVYVNNVYKKEIKDVNVTWTEVESLILSLEFDFLEIKFKESDEYISVVSTYLLSIVERAYELETEIEKFLLGNKNPNKIKIKYKKLYSEYSDLSYIFDDYFIDLNEKEYTFFYKNKKITQDLYNSLKDYNLLLGKYYNYEKYDKIFKILNKLNND